MSHIHNRRLARAALILALALLFQSLRFLLPVPPLFSTFIIGTLVNACLLVAVEVAGWWAAMFIALVAPVVAWFQQLLPVPLLILPVAAGNTAYVLIYGALLHKHRWSGLTLASLAKIFLLYGSVHLLLGLLAIPSNIAAGILFVMSWPQLFTALAGGILANQVTRRLSGVR